MNGKGNGVGEGLPPALYVADNAKVIAAMESLGRSNNVRQTLTDRYALTHYQVEPTASVRFIITTPNGSREGCTAKRATRGGNRNDYLPILTGKKNGEEDEKRQKCYPNEHDHSFIFLICGEPPAAGGSPETYIFILQSLNPSCNVESSKFKVNRPCERFFLTALPVLYKP